MNSTNSNNDNDDAMDIVTAEDLNDFDYVIEVHLSSSSPQLISSLTPLQSHCIIIIGSISFLSLQSATFRCNQDISSNYQQTSLKPGRAWRMSKITERSSVLQN